MALLQITAAAWSGQAVHVAAKFGIADLLERGPKSPAALAEIVGPMRTPLADSCARA